MEGIAITHQYDISIVAVPFTEATKQWDKIGGCTSTATRKTLAF